MAWSAKPTGAYSKDSAEGKENVKEIARMLDNAGWDIKAMAALLGNGAGESGLNPWRWESDNVPTVAQFNSWTPAETLIHGYGIFGYTPANKYINSTSAGLYDGYSPNFADSPGTPQDGKAQVSYFLDTVESNWTGGNYNYYYDDFITYGVNIDNFYFINFEDFIAGDDDLANLVGAFELKYEKPADWAAASSYFYRVQAAEDWLQFLKDEGYGKKKDIIIFWRNHKLKGFRL